MTEIKRNGKGKKEKIVKKKVKAEIQGIQLHQWYKGIG